MKLPLHRSISFWAGLYLITFLAWMWWDSNYRVSFVRKDGWELRSHCSGISLTFTTRPRSLDFPNSKSGRMARSSRYSFVPAPHFIKGSGAQPSRWGITTADVPTTYRRHLEKDVWMYRPTQDWTRFFPYWIIFLAAALPWTGLLLWSTRHSTFMKAARSAVLIWSGPISMSCLTWAWWDSVSRASILWVGKWNLESAYGGVSFSHSSVGFRWVDYRRTDMPHVDSFTRSHFPPVIFNVGKHETWPDGSIRDDQQGAPRDLREHRDAIYKNRTTSDWSLFVPYWLILLGTSVTWIALFAWHRRRASREAPNLPGIAMGSDGVTDA